MKKVISIVVILAIIGSIFFYLQYNKQHIDTSNEKADITLTPAALLASYNDNESLADSLYLDKIIEVAGNITSINQVEVGGSISLATGDDMSMIICEFQDASIIASLSVGQMVTVKGICSGKLIDIVLSRCSIVDSK